jgi:2-iminobutanoate/2-iminopropanoate deaminase
MEIVGVDIEAQTERALKNIEIVLKGLGLSLQNVVKSTVYLKDMADFHGMNRVYARMFQPHSPARTTVSVRQNPLDALVEIECIAEIPDKAS